MTETIEVIKLNEKRQETWRYSGTVLKRGDRSILLEAFFDREDRPFHDIVLANGDRFVEIYYSDRWYNINEIHDRADDHLKGWYCNITLPAEFGPGVIYYVDLALDLLVYPDGRQLVLDEDEFEMIEIPQEIRAQAEAALTELQALFKRQATPRLLD